MKAKNLPAPNPTARELLEVVGGKTHALHSVAEWQTRGDVYITCSCKEAFQVEYDPVVVKALKNAPRVETTT